MDNDRQHDQDAPPGLIHAFKKLRSKDVSIPQSVDDTVLATARRRLSKPSRRRAFPGLGWWDSVSAWPNWARVPALAAACFLVAFVAYSVVQHNTPPRFAREDVNRDGRVDILDAFQLARKLQSGAALPPALDFNGDGLVDSSDADAIAAEAVSLEQKGGRS